MRGEQRRRSLKNGNRRDRRHRPLIFHVRIERAGETWGEGEENRIGGESGAGEETSK